MTKNKFLKVNFCNFQTQKSCLTDRNLSREQYFKVKIEQKICKIEFFLGQILALFFSFSLFAILFVTLKQ